MTRSILITIYTLSVFLFGWLMTPVEISMQAPTEMVAGMSFDVEVVINKSSVDGFARFQQKLPEGFSAELIDAATGDFRFDEQTVKFFWLIIPNREEIILKYRITTDQNISGKYSIGGIFSYIDGDKKYVEMPLHEITITPSPLADAVQDTAKIEMEALPQISCKRQSVNLNQDGEIVIEILVNRGDLAVDQFAKIQETIPKGYDAQSVETQGGIFTFQNNVAKFLWMTLPSEQEFLVSYKLVPQDNTNFAKLDIEGNFSYLVNGQTVEVGLEEMNKPMSQIIEEQLAYRQGDLVQEEDASEFVADTQVTDPETDVVNDNNKETDLVENDVVEASTETQAIVDVPSPNTQVDYRIQIAAGHKKVKVKPYFTKLKVKEKVNVEMLEGWYKYTVGSYDEYLQARNKRNKVWNDTPISDAFVAAYNNGQRITVQEALMITNQTWYQ